MNFKGRTIDPLHLWSQYVEFPPNVQADGEFLPLVTCPNPSHDTMKRHFQINTQQPLVHCFARCGISGTYQRAISMIEGIKESEARRLILKAATGIGSGASISKPVGKSSSADDRPIATVPDLSLFSFLPAVGTEYLRSRGISKSTIAAWQLGWNPENGRIVIPAFDQDRHLKFIIQRAVKASDYPRYLYPDGSGEAKKRLLFGIPMLDRSLVSSTGLILVEGSMDAIKLYELGFRNVVATLGNHVGKYQRIAISSLRPRRLFLLFDCDTGGISALQSAHHSIRKPGMLVCRYPTGIQDPADFNHRREVDRAIERAVPIQKWIKNIPEANRTYRR